jgi:hypothetical protein
MFQWFYLLTFLLCVPPGMPTKTLITKISNYNNNKNHNRAILILCINYLDAAIASGLKGEFASSAGLNRHIFLVFQLHYIV